MGSTNPPIGNQWKHLLIILSLLLLLSSPLFGQETGVLYKWVFSDKIVWKTFGVDSKHDQYVGETRNGLPHGLGYTYFYKKDNVLYYGEWKDGEFHGQGTWTTKDGEKYVGGWREGKFHGQGTHITGFGLKYEGGWKDGKQHGQGTETWNDGDKYVGRFKNQLKHGQGTYTNSDGEKYVGE